MKILSIFKGRSRQAAWAYVGVKLLVAALIFFFLPCSICGNWKRYLFSTILRISILGHFIYMGFRISTKGLTVTNTVRVFFNLIDFFIAKKITIAVPFFSAPMVVSTVDNTGNYILVINAVLGGFAAVMLARAGWGFGLKREVIGRRKGDAKMDKTLDKQEEVGSTVEITWTDEAVKRIELAPPFVKNIIEKKAKDLGVYNITTELLEQLRSHSM
ncbi:MAG: PCP reductase family protein [Thermodesulfobacteriota bacterium]